MSEIPGQHLESAVLAAKLYEYPDLLAQQDADAIRIVAYRRATDAVSGLTQPVSESDLRPGSMFLRRKQMPKITPIEQQITNAQSDAKESQAGHCGVAG